MKKIAILKYNNQCYYHGDGDELWIANSISDWTEVSDEDYNILIQAQNTYTFRVIERPENEKEFIEKTVSHYIKVVKERNEKMKQQREIEDKKKREKAEARDKKKLEQLKAKYEKKLEELKDKELSK
jgi:hypothetical protein